MPEYQLTANVWARAILEDEFGVKPSDISWVRGPITDAERPEKISIKLPPDVKLQDAPAGKTISQLLADGEIDGFIAPRAPDLDLRKHRNIGWLFPDPTAAAKDYYKRSGIFPIMHLVGVRRELVQEHPWLPAALLKAFEQAKAAALGLLRDTSATKVTLPFVEENLKAARELMGEDFWPYGVAANRKTLEAFLRRHHAEGLSSRLVKVDEMFHPSTYESFKVSSSCVVPVERRREPGPTKVQRWVPKWLASWSIGSALISPPGMASCKAIDGRAAATRPLAAGGRAPAARDSRRQASMPTFCWKARTAFMVSGPTRPSVPCVSKPIAVRRCLDLLQFRQSQPALAAGKLLLEIRQAADQVAEMQQRQRIGIRRVVGAEGEIVLPDQESRTATLGDPEPHFIARPGKSRAVSACDAKLPPFGISASWSSCRPLPVEAIRSRTSQPQISPRR